MFGMLVGLAALTLNVELNSIKVHSENSGIKKRVFFKFQCKFKKVNYYVNRWLFLTSSYLECIQYTQ